MPKVKIINPEGSGWLGTQYSIDGTKIENVRSADFHVAVDEIPTSTFELLALPDIEMESKVRFEYTAQSVDDAIRVLRHELLAHGKIYNGFKSSLKSAMKAYNVDGLPSETDDEIAEEILDFVIGEER